MDHASQQSAMIEGLKGVLRYVSHFDAPQLTDITALFKPKMVKKNTTLVAEGETCKEFYYVHTGCIRTCFITPGGDEKTRYIMFDRFIGTALTSFITQKPSFETLHALEDSQLLTISHKDFYELNTQMPQWKDFYQKILEMAYAFQNSRIESMVTLTARERYSQLLKEHPVFIQRLSNKVLASYLDIRQETLSRLKSR